MTKIRDGITGLIIGDALGVPYEFRTPYEMQQDPCTTMTGNIGTWNKPLGSWSDDTSMTLATMSAISKNNGEINYDDIMKAFVRWIANGEYSCDGDVFDYGQTTLLSISNYINGVPINECGGTQENNNGNGSLMRILPLAWTSADYETIGNVSGLTHNTDRCRIACSLYVEIARQILDDPQHEHTFCDHVANASELIQEYYKDNQELKKFQRIFDADYSLGVSSSGHVLNTLECAIYCIREEPSYKDALLRAVNLGNDTDTVGAVCGGLAGIYYGYDDIPVDWINSIYSLDYANTIIDEFEKTIQ